MRVIGSKFPSNHITPSCWDIDVFLRHALYNWRHLLHSWYFFFCESYSINFFSPAFLPVLPCSVKFFFFQNWGLSVYVQKPLVSYFNSLFVFWETCNSQKLAPNGYQGPSKAGKYHFKKHKPHHRSGNRFLSKHILRNTVFSNTVRCLIDLYKNLLTET